MNTAKSNDRPILSNEETQVDQSDGTRQLAEQLSRFEHTLLPDWQPLSKEQLSRQRQEMAQREKELVQGQRGLVRSQERLFQEQYRIVERQRDAVRAQRQRGQSLQQIAEGEQLLRQEQQLMGEMQLSLFQAQQLLFDIEQGSEPAPGVQEMPSLVPQSGTGKAAPSSDNWTGPLGPRNLLLQLQSTQRGRSSLSENQRQESALSHIKPPSRLGSSTSINTAASTEAEPRPAYGTCSIVNSPYPL